MIHHFALEVRREESETEASFRRNGFQDELHKYNKRSPRIKTLLEKAESKTRQAALIRSLSTKCKRLSYFNHVW